MDNNRIHKFFISLMAMPLLLASVVIAIVVIISLPIVALIKPNLITMSTLQDERKNND